MPDLSRMPRWGERTAEYQQGYGRCQCGCGGLVEETDGAGLFVRFIQDHDAVAVSRRAGLESGEPPQQRRPFGSGAALDRRESEPQTSAGLDTADNFAIQPGRYTRRRVHEPGRRETDRLVDMFAEQTHARQQLQVKLGILESEMEFAIKYIKMFCGDQHAVGDALVSRLEAALQAVRRESS